MINIPLNEINITESAQETFREGERMLRDAKAWVDEAEDVPDLERRRYRFHEMEMSFYTNIAHLIFTYQTYDGELAIDRDGPGSFFWKHKRSGYHGGLIFHADYYGNEPQPVGTWSIHT